MLHQTVTCCLVMWALSPAMISPLPSNSQASETHKSSKDGVWLSMWRSDLNKNDNKLKSLTQFSHPHICQSMIAYFAYLNQIHKFCSAVNSISEQINLFKRQSSVCAYVCVNYVNYKFVYSVTFVVSKTVL